MDVALRILACLAGTALVAAAVTSAMKTVVIPRAEASGVTRLAFLLVRRVYLLWAPASAPYEIRDRRLASYAPVGLVATLVVWLGLALAGYTLLFAGADGLDLWTAFETSGSSLFTLGIARPEGAGAVVLVFTEAAIGLFLLALMITYLPTVYSAYSRRELGVTALEVRAGSPPTGREMIERHHQLERLGELHEVWVEWERWFVDVEESHTSLAALNFFRSPQPDHSWVTAAGAVLDGAALTLAAVAIPRDVAAEFCLRAGYLSLRRIAGFFRVPFDPAPRPDDPISIRREEFDAVLDGFAAIGVPLKADRDQAWRDFAGWRVNYDVVLVALAGLTTAPPAPWSSDRAVDRSFRPPVGRGRRSG